MAAKENAAHAGSHLTFTALILIWLLASLDQSIVSTTLPAMAKDLHGLTQLSWVVTAYILTGVVTAPIYGKLGDLFGRKSVLQFCIAVFLIGSLLCGMAQDMFQLVAFRALQGVGAGGLFVTALAVVADIAPPHKRGNYQGLLTATFGLATVAGPLIGGYCVDYLSWRWIFYANLPIGLVAGVVLTTSLPRVSAGRAAPRVDYLGAMLLSVTLILVVLAMSLRSIGLTSSAMMLAVAMLSGFGFTAVEARAREPILPLDLFRIHNFRIACGTGLIVGVSFLGSVPFLPLYLQDVRGLSTSAAGLALMPLLLSMAVASIATGRLISIFRRYKPFPVAGTLLMTLALFLIARLSSTTAGWAITAEVALLGTGMGMVSQVLVLFVQNSVDPKDIGVATSSLAMFRAIGSLVGVSVFGAALAASNTGALRLMSSTATPENLGVNSAGVIGAALQPVFAGAVGIAALAGLLSWTLREFPRRESGT